MYSIQFYIIYDDITSLVRSLPLPELKVYIHFKIHLKYTIVMKNDAEILFIVHGIQILSFGIYLFNWLAFLQVMF